MGRNISETRIVQILESVDKIENLQLLLGRENLEKSNLQFKDWIRSRDPNFLDRHLIPKNWALWDVEALPEFVKEREKLIRQRLKRLNFDPQEISGDRIQLVEGLETGN